MGKQRKYLDRGRKILLEGRPVEVDWMALLGAGRKAVQEGRAATTPVLSYVMWQGVNPAVVHPRPAPMDFPLMREWLYVEEEAATSFLRREWGMLRAPDCAEEALEMMARPDCFAAGLGTHRLTADKFSLPDGEGGEWVVGPCRDCFRSLLWHFPADGGRCETWPFYDQEVEYDGTVGADQR